MISPNDLARLKSQCAADLQSIAAGVGLPLEAQRERVMVLADVLDEMKRLWTILDNTPPTVTPYESESFITDLNDEIDAEREHLYRHHGIVSNDSGTTP